MTRDELRDARNREAMAHFELDAVICRLPENVLLLTGYWPLSSFAFAVAAREAPGALIVMDTEEASVPNTAAERVLVVSTRMGAPGQHESRTRDGRRACEGCVPPWQKRSRDLPNSPM